MVDRGIVQQPGEGWIAPKLVEQKPLEVPPIRFRIPQIVVDCLLQGRGSATGVAVQRGQLSPNRQWVLKEQMLRPISRRPSRRLGERLCLEAGGVLQRSAKQSRLEKHHVRQRVVVAL